MVAGARWPDENRLLMTPEECTADAAPEIDRLVIAIHLRSRERGRAVARRYGLDRAGPVLEFRTAILAGPVARSTAEGVARYFAPGQLDEELRNQVGHGIFVVDETDGHLRLTERGRALAEDLYDLHALVTVEAWSSHQPEVRRLNDLTGRLLAAGRATAGPAFAGMSTPYERPRDPMELLLFNRLGAFRYHRADAHAAAWAAAGHTAESINALEPGPEREAIEADTNRRAAAPYEALAPAERLQLLTALAALP
jgi:hypothetical protein